MRSLPQIETILKEVPSEWRTRGDLRCYMAFIKQPATAQEAVKEVEVKDGVDFVKAGEGVLYLATLLSGLTRSGFTKLAGKKIYKNMTMRNYNTVQKIYAMMTSQK